MIYCLFWKIQPLKLYPVPGISFPWMTFLYCFPTFLELMLLWHFSVFLARGQNPLSDTKQVQPLFYPWIPRMLRHEEACWQTDRPSVWQRIVDRSCRGGPGSQQDTETDRSPRPDRSAALPVSSSSAAVNSRFYLSSPSAPCYLLTSDLEPTISCTPRPLTFHLHRSWSVSCYLSARLFVLSLSLADQ